MSSRGTKRSRFFRAGKRRKERLLRRLAMTPKCAALAMTPKCATLAMTDKRCHREVRGDLGFSGLAKREKRDCFADSPVIASAARQSRLSTASKQKREIAAQARNDR